MNCCRVKKFKKGRDDVVDRYWCCSHTALSIDTKPSPKSPTMGREPLVMPFGWLWTCCRDLHSETDVHITPCLTLMQCKTGFVNAL